MTTIVGVFRRTAGWTEPPAPLADAPDSPHKADITPNHPAWHRRHDPQVWGALAGHGVHNPMFDSAPEPGHWQEGSTHKFWNDLREEEPDTHRAAAASLKRGIAGSHVAIAAPTHALHRMLDDGEIRSAFQTRATGATKVGIDEYLDNHRRLGEHGHFGYPFEHPDHARPVYGFLTHHPFAEDTAQGYGSHTLVLSRPAVAHRTTWTSADTLNYQSEVRPSPLTAPRLRSVAPGMTWDSGRHSDDENGVHDRGVHKMVSTIDTRPSYLEAQIHGGLPLRHVHYAILRTSPEHDHDARALGERLSGHGIPWIHQHGYHLPDRAETWDDGHRRIGALMNHTHEAVASGALSARYRSQIRLGQGPKRFVVELQDPGRMGLAMGQIADLEWKKLYPPQPVASIVRAGYWEELAEPIDAEDILALVRPA